MGRNYSFIHHMNDMRKSRSRDRPASMDGVPVLKYTTVLFATLLSMILGSAADATPRHHRQQHTIVCDMRGCSDNVVGAQTRSYAQAPVLTDANGGSVISRRPAGCPHAFCGCEASLYLFGRIRAELNLASNWMRKFPRTSPAPGMAAVRNHHVMVLMSHVEGNNWMVHDGNSGGGLTREHVVSIRGYVIVNPRDALASM
jgi:hypothetical protein